MEHSKLVNAMVTGVLTRAEIVAEIRSRLGLKGNATAPTKAAGGKAWTDFAARLAAVQQEVTATELWGILRKTWRAPELDADTYNRACTVLTKAGAGSKKADRRTGAEETAYKAADKRWQRWRADAGLDAVSNKGGKRDRADSKQNEKADAADEPAKLIKADAADAPKSDAAPVTADSARDYYRTTGATVMQYAKKNAKHVRGCDKLASQAFHMIVTADELTPAQGDALNALLAALANKS